MWLYCTSVLLLLVLFSTFLMNLLIIDMMDIACEKLINILRIMIYIFLDYICF